MTNGFKLGIEAAAKVVQSCRDKHAPQDELLGYIIGEIRALPIPDTPAGEVDVERCRELFSDLLRKAQHGAVPSGACIAAAEAGAFLLDRLDASPAPVTPKRVLIPTNSEWPGGVSDGLVSPCKLCCRIPEFDYLLKDEVWDDIVSENDRRDVICLPCLDRLAFAKRIDFAESLKQVQFTGHGQTIVLTPTAFFDYDARPRHAQPAAPVGDPDDKIRIMFAEYVDAIDRGEEQIDSQKHADAIDAVRKFLGREPNTSVPYRYTNESREAHRSRARAWMADREDAAVPVAGDWMKAAVKDIYDVATHFDLTHENIERCIARHAPVSEGGKDERGE
jgi:hypothetical protein